MIATPDATPAAPQRPRHLTDTETAAVIRRCLKTEFPSTKFSVRCQRGGSSVTVRWTDGPTEGRVDAFLGAFAIGHFDGMTDSYHYDRTAVAVVDGEAVRFGARYLFTERAASDAHWATVAAIVAVRCGVPVPERRAAHNVRVPHMENGGFVYFSDLVYRAMRNRASVTD